MEQTRTQPTDKRMGPKRVIAAIVIAAVLIFLAIVLYSKNHKASAPSRSTFQMQTNKEQNSPPGGSVTNGGNQSQDTVPSSSGTGSNAQVSH